MQHTRREFLENRFRRAWGSADDGEDTYENPFWYVPYSLRCVRDASCYGLVGALRELLMNSFSMEIIV